MAIRYPWHDGNTNPWAENAVTSGWRIHRADPSGQFSFQVGASQQAFQPGRLTRPGNLGTAHIGVWTGNMSQE